MTNKIFDRECMEKALNSEVHTVPEGLSRDEMRNYINMVAFLNILEEEFEEGKGDE